MPAQTSEHSSSFAQQNLNELIFSLARGFNGTTFGELADAYRRMLEIAFDEISTRNDDRALAAAWASVIESLIVLTLVNREQLLKAFIEARNMSKANAEKYGYGSVGWTAIHEPNAMMDRVLGDDAATSQAGKKDIEDRRAFLLSVAFGRVNDGSNGAG